MSDAPLTSKELLNKARPFVDICAGGGVGNTDAAFEAEAKAVVDEIDGVLAEPPPRLACSHPWDRVGFSGDGHPFCSECCTNLVKDPPWSSHEPADALQSVQTIFLAAVSSLAEISQALDIPDHVASVANGNAEILKAIAHLKRASSPPSDAHPDTLLLNAFPGVREELQHVLRNRTTLTKSEGPYGCIHDSSPTTWCGVCYPEKCTATETSGTRE